MTAPSRNYSDVIDSGPKMAAASLPWPKLIVEKGTGDIRARDGSADYDPKAITIDPTSCHRLLVPVQCTESAGRPGICNPHFSDCNE